MCCILQRGRGFSGAGDGDQVFTWASEIGNEDSMVSMVC